MSPKTPRQICSCILVSAALAITQPARAVQPPPDGGYSKLNTAEGEDALFNLTTGFQNTAIGYHALYNEAVGGLNTAIGSWALAAHNSLTYGASTAVGSHALEKATVGSNIAVGSHVLGKTTTGIYNIAVGGLYENVDGSFNVSVGLSALAANRDGDNNTAVGSSALSGNTAGSANCGFGVDALSFNSTGEANVGVGRGALHNNLGGSTNVAIGNNALVSALNGNSNVAIGNFAAQNIKRGSNNIIIANDGVNDDNGRIRIGTEGNQTTAFIAGISGVTIAGGVGVVIDANGQLGTMTSSARFKDGIKPMDKASEAILGLQPVTFHYKHELDPAGIPQFGLVAEQVEKVNPELVARDDQGKPYTVRYEAVNAMLLNEFLKEHRKVEAQGVEISELKAAVAALQLTAKSQAAELQKVSAALDTNGSAARLVSTRP